MDVLSWRELELFYNEEVVARIEASFASRLKQREIAGQSIGIRSFMTLLAREASKAFEPIRQLLNGADIGNPDELRVLLHQAAKRWAKFLDAEGILSQTTVNHHANRLRWALRALHHDNPGRFPKIEKGFLKRKEPRNTGTHESLGVQKWAELEGLTGASRERAALNIVRAEAIELFKDLETMFWFGQRAISDDDQPPDGADRKAWLQVRARIRHAAFTGSKTNPRFGEDGIRFASLSDPELWKAAGLDVDVTWRGPLERRGVSKLIDFCLAPTLELCHLVATIYCCSTAWNRQPTFDIARHPFIFATSGKRGVVTASFLAELKKRADHDVKAYLESARTLSHLRIDDLRALIQQTALELPSLENGAFDELQADDEALDVLERFMRMTERIDTSTLPESYKNKLFFYKANGRFRLAAESKKPLSYLKLFKRQGVDYPAIRKTVLGLKLRSVGSVDGLSVVADHNNTKTLMPHYINTDADKDEYGAKIRFAQNNIQALLTGKREKLRIRLKLSSEELEYYLRLTKVSGIGAAMLPVELVKLEAQEPYEFSPSDTYLRSLYLISFSLVRSRLDGMSKMRWIVQGRELLILARSIKLALIESGLGEALRKQSRLAFARLKDGTYHLPALLTD